MTNVSQPVTDESARPWRPGAETALTAWLHRSLSRQYDAVLEEELPVVLAALAGMTTTEH